MHYRPLTEQDRERYLALEGYAFRSNPDRAGLDAERMAGLRGLFVDGTLAAQLELIPLTLRTGLGTIAAAGVGSVASAPETRRRGHVDALMRHLAHELRAAGVPLCALYPFKRSFYGRQGFATFYERKRYTGAPALFAPFKRLPGAFVPAGDADIPELDRIYTGALRGRFGPVVRDPAWWRGRVLSGWDGKTPHYTYIWRDEAGQGRSYLIFRFQSEGGNDTMLCQEMVALDPVARSQLFAFIAGHEDQVETVRFQAPPDAPVNLLFPDPLECAAEPRFMLRVLDVAAALEAYAFPRGAAGRLSLAVRDAWLPENQGVYELELAGGACQVRRLPADAPADLACDVTTLAQLLSRLLRPRTAAAFGLLEAAGRAPLDLAEQAFAGLAPFGSDFF
jgi:predicted acetyltransferase